ncbi:unnamed protein product [Closterium sp. NIES-54]
MPMRRPHQTRRRCLTRCSPSARVTRRFGLVLVAACLSVSIHRPQFLLHPPPPIPPPLPPPPPQPPPAPTSSSTHCPCAAPSPLRIAAAPTLVPCPLSPTPLRHPLQSHACFRAQACSAQQKRSGAAQPGSMLAGFEHSEHVCGAAWRDEYAQLHARIRAASRDTWRARQPACTMQAHSSLRGRGEAGCKRVRVRVHKRTTPPSAPRSSAATPPPPPAAPPVPPPSAPPPQPAAPRRRLADGSPPGAEPGGADTAGAAVRFLTYDWYGSCGGLGDYLIGLVSLFPAALLVAQPCMHAAFRSPHIDTALSPDVPMGGRPLLRATPPPLNAAAPAHDGPGDEPRDEPQRVEWHTPPCERLEGNLGAAGRDSSAVPCLDLPRHTIEIEALQQLSALSNYRVRYNKGLLITTLLHNQGPWAAALRQLGFKVAYGFGCILWFLFRSASRALR